MVKWNRIKEHLFEFFLIGVLLGVIEDVIAIMFYGGAFALNWKMIYVAAAVAMPFAILSELVVDRTEIFRLNNLRKRFNF